MDTSDVEKFFAIWPNEDQKKGETLEVRADKPIQTFSKQSVLQTIVRIQIFQEGMRQRKFNNTKIKVL